MTTAEMDKISNGLATKSAKIRALALAGATRSEIANYLSIRYQHVRNVLVSPSGSSGGGGGARNPPSHTDDPPPPVIPLSIEEAKRGLAARFGVPTSAIEITIKG